MSGRYREFDEKNALENAAEVFWLKGYEASSTEELLAAMNLNKGSMYNAFGNKRQLFLKVFQWFAENSLNNMKALFKKNKNPMDAIEELFYGVARAQDPAAHAKGCFYGNILGEMSGRDAELVKIARQNLINVEELFKSELERGVKAGYLIRSMEPVVMAKYLVNLWNGLSVSRRMYNRKDLEKLVTLNLKILKDS